MARRSGFNRRGANHHGPTLAMQPAGQDPEARVVPGTVTLRPVMATQTQQAGDAR
jgi:hypothetical protein